MNIGATVGHALGTIWTAIRRNPIRAIGYASIGLEQIAVELPGVKAAAAYRVAVGVVTFLATEYGRTQVTPAVAPIDPAVEGQVGFPGE